MTNIDEFVVNLTSEATKGFKKHVDLPPIEMFSGSRKVKMVEADCQAKIRGLFFDSKTDWAKHHLVLYLKSGVLFIYVTEQAGYALRIPAAHTIAFQGKRHNNNNKTHSSSELETTTSSVVDSLNSCVVKLKFTYGHMKIRFPQHIAPEWRPVLLSAHECSLSPPTSNRSRYNSECSSLCSKTTTAKSPTKAIIRGPSKITLIRQRRSPPPTSVCEECEEEIIEKNDETKDEDKNGN
uniref:PH domain-containing protein n=1 Tax=Panagrolaimus sp. JU765 TaxID=591449 RepID=A0AC34QGK9_9BILA